MLVRFFIDRPVLAWVISIVILYATINLQDALARIEGWETKPRFVRMPRPSNN
jgi:hypothetical protein